jgi:hypothetical protein
MDDEVIQTAVKLRLGMGLCVPRPCQHKAQVEPYGVHSLVGRRASENKIKEKPCSQVLM